MMVFIEVFIIVQINDQSTEAMSCEINVNTRKCANSLLIQF